MKKANSGFNNFQTADHKQTFVFYTNIQKRKKIKKPKFSKVLLNYTPKRKKTIVVSLERKQENTKSITLYYNLATLEVRC